MRSWPRGNWIYSRDILRATEGGSSGFPVLNSSGQVVGQLSGACGFNRKLRQVTHRFDGS